MEKDKSSWIENDGRKENIEVMLDEIKMLIYLRQDIIIEFMDHASAFELDFVFTDEELRCMKNRLLEKNMDELVDQTYMYMYEHTRHCLFDKEKQEIEWE